MDNDQLIGLVVAIVGVIICGIGSYFAATQELMMLIVIFIITLIIGGGAIVYGIIMYHPDINFK